MKQLSRLAQKLFTLGATELMRRDGPPESMAVRVGIVLQNQISSRRERDHLAPNPSQHPPDGAVVECTLVNGTARWCHIADDSIARLGDLSIRLSGILDVSLSQIEQRRTGVAFVGSYENRDNR